MWGSIRGRFYALIAKFSTWTKVHRKLVVGTSVLLILALAVPPILFNNPKTAEAALTTIRQEVNIIDGYLSAASGSYATSSEIVLIDPAKYNGETFYFEVVASTTSGTNATVSLVDASTGAVARSITVNGTAHDRYRSTSFTPGAATAYKVRLGNESVGKGLIAARIVILQNNNPITDTQTQIEVGARETYTSSATSTFAAPKYWKYNSSNWDGSPTFYAEVTYANTAGGATTTDTYATARTGSLKATSTYTHIAAWGGGGAGFDGGNSGGGAGGGGGAFASSSVTLVPGQTYSFTVGSGGSTSGGAGSDTTFNSTTVVADGGVGGSSATTGEGTGGTTANSTGQVEQAGGQGGSGNNGDDSGGGGGAGAGPHGDGGAGADASATDGGGGGGGNGGNPGSGATGGSSTNGGAGANGDTNGTTAPNANAGTSNSRGGGGGGGGDQASAGGNGGAPGGGGAGGEGGQGNGAAGQLTLTYRPVGSTNIVLQESDGTGDGFTGWSDKVYIVRSGSSTSPTRVRSSSFSPTAGRNYRIAFREVTTGATHAIYNAKIIVDQASSPTKLEAQYLLANRTLFSGTALQKYHTYWDAAEWTNSANTYTHQVDAANGSASVVEVDTEAGTQVTNSVVTSPDNAGVSSAMTMPATGDLDIKATTNNSDIYASRILVAVTPDTTAPTPNPYFTAAPTSTTTTMVSMTSVEITDSNAVEYFFTATSSTCGGNLGSGRTNSGWISSRNYSDIGLSPNQCYAYTVKGRDAAGNMTSTSTASTTYTRANTPGSVTYVNGSVTVTTLEIVNDANGNPSSAPTTYFAVYASSTDSRWGGKWLRNAGSNVVGTSTSPQWLSDSEIDGLNALINLLPNTRYDFEVVARNQDQVLTATSTRTGTTTLADTAGPTPSTSTFSSPPNNVSGTEINMTATAGSDISTPISYFFDYTGTCAADNGNGGTNSGWQQDPGGNTYSDTGLDVNKCYSYITRMRDSLGNMNSSSTVAQAYTTANTPSAPTLSNAGETTFDIDNNANGNPSNTEFAAQIIATSPSDSDWNNKYINASGGSSTAQVWMSDATLDAVTVTGLNFSTQYTVQVMARNGDNEVTASSSSSNITTSADGTAPTPNPFFSSVPANDSVSQISMTSTAVNDPTTPVNYYFTAVVGSCGANWGTGYDSSGWQAGASYSDSGLQTNKCYGYTVTAKDNSNNVTATSTASSTYTSAAVPGAPTQVSVTDEAITLSINANGNPASNPTTYFAIQVSATSPTDNNWLNQYADASGNPNGSAQWLTAAQLTNFTVNGLQPTTDYTFRVKARNQDLDETAFGSTATFTTQNPIFPETRIQGGTRLQGIRVY